MGHTNTTTDLAPDWTLEILTLLDTAVVVLVRYRGRRL